MKVSHVSLCPSQGAANAGRLALTPELLAATGARYSRNNEGLEAIAAKIDPANLDKSVDSIFKMIDYGHASIADMAPVSMFIDGVTIWLAYLVWSRSSVAGGQESSTRYLELGVSDLADPDEIGIPHGLLDAWKDAMADSMEAYSKALALWSNYATENPDATRIPASLREDTSPRATKQVERMERNFAFDRARYFLPVAVRTNMMLVMSARAWVQLIQWLSSHYLPEAQILATKLREELDLVTPRLTKHATRIASMEAGLREEFESLIYLSRHESEFPNEFGLDIQEPNHLISGGMAHALSFHDNRYAYLGESLGRTSVRFYWDAISIAEIRDLNRHRTGTKFCPAVSRGFYGALDQAEPSSTIATELSALIAEVGERCADTSLLLLRDELPESCYWMNLGTKLYFEHTTTADKFLYEAELRTGVGAHYRYAEHLREMLELWYERYPDTKGLVLEGSAEPE